MWGEGRSSKFETRNSKQARRSKFEEEIFNHGCPGINTDLEKTQIARIITNY